MDFAKILAQLREELKNLDAAIATLERLQEGGRRRSRSSTGIDLTNLEEPPAQAKNTHPARLSASRKSRRKDPGAT